MKELFYNAAPANKTRPPKIARLVEAPPPLGGLFTFVSVGVGISQAIIANRTLVAISGQLTEMQSSSEQVERSIKASNRIADESKAANVLTGEANRPWVSAESDHHFPFAVLVTAVE